MHEIDDVSQRGQRYGEWRISMAGGSDVGRVRGNNEDYLDWDVARGLALLADGVGGRNAGEVASRMAVTTLLEQIPWSVAAEDGETCVEQLQRAIGLANQRIHESAQYAPFLGMSTTLTALWLCGHRAILAHVGDSRIYRLREGQLQQMTVDHSLVQEMVDSGALTSQEAQCSANRHLITRALGLSGCVAADVVEVELCAGDRYLLCSDGVSDMLDETALTALLTAPAAPLERIVETVIEQANRQGGDDNISALLVAIDKP